MRGEPALEPTEPVDLDRDMVTRTRRRCGQRISGQQHVAGMHRHEFTDVADQHPDRTQHVGSLPLRHEHVIHISADHQVVRFGHVFAIDEPWAHGTRAVEALLDDRWPIQVIFRNREIDRDRVSGHTLVRCLDTGARARRTEYQAQACADLHAIDSQRQRHQRAVTDMGVVRLDVQHRRRWRLDVWRLDHPVAIVLDRCRVVEDHAIDESFGRLVPAGMRQVNGIAAEQRRVAELASVNLDGPGLAGQRNTGVQHQSCSRLPRGRLAARNAIWSERIVRLRRIMSSQSDGTYGA